MAICKYDSVYNTSFIEHYYIYISGIHAAVDISYHMK